VDAAAGRLVKSVVAEQRLIESKCCQLDPVGEEVKTRAVAWRSVFVPLALARDVPTANHPHQRFLFQE